MIAGQKEEPAVQDFSAFIQEVSAQMARRSPEDLLMVVKEVNVRYLIYFAGAFFPMVVVTFFLFGSWISGYGTFLACVPALCGAAWAAFHFGQERYKQIILKRMRNLLNFF